MMLYQLFKKEGDEVPVLLSSQDTDAIFSYASAQFARQFQISERCHLQWEIVLRDSNGRTVLYRAKDTNLFVSASYDDPPARKRG